MATTTKTKAKKKADIPKASDNAVYKRVREEIGQFSKAVGEVETQYREFKVAQFEGEDRVFRVRFLSPAEESGVNEAYSAKYGELLQDENMLPSDQIIEIMKKRGLWSDKKDERLDALLQRSARLKNIIYLSGDSMTSEEMDKYAKEYTEVETEHAELLSVKNSFIANSIEARAYETRMKDQIWRCVTIVKEDDSEEKYWPTAEALGAEQDKVLISRVMNECIAFWQGVPSDFLEEKPEAQSGESDTQ